MLRLCIQEYGKLLFVEYRQRDGIRKTDDFFILRRMFMDVYRFSDQF